jgi:hypothetical protein
MTKKNLQNVCWVVVLTLVVAGASPAHTFELRGSGTQLYEEHLTGNNIVQPGGVITVTISNNQPGYQRFWIYIAGEDADGEEVLLWGTFVGGDNCRPGSSCVFDIPNVPQPQIPANEVAVMGFFGGIGARATVTHVTHNP